MHHFLKEIFLELKSLLCPHLPSENLSKTNSVTSGWFS